MKTFVAIASKHWKAVVGFNLIIFLVALGVISLVPKTWKAKAQLILPSTNGSSLDANLGTLGSYRNSDPSFSVQVNPLKIQQTILTSDALLEQVWKADPEYDKSPKPNNYARFFEVTIPEQTSVMNLSVTGSSPEIARQRTTVMLKAYNQRLDELRQANSATKEKFSRKQLEKARQTLTQAQNAVSGFKGKSGLVNNEEQTRGMVEAINNLSTTQAQAQAQAQASRERAKNLATRLQLSPGEAMQSLGLSQNEGYNQLRSKLTEAEMNVRRLSNTYTTESPQVQQALSDSASLRLQLKQYVDRAAGNFKIDTSVTSGAEGRSNLIQQLVLAESDVNERQQQIAQLQKQIDIRRASLNAIPVAQAQLESLQRQVDVAEGVYKGLIAQVQQSNIDAFNSYPNIQQLNVPIVDPKPSSPKLSLVALNALLASIIGSIALILLLESRNPLLNPNDIQLFEFPLIARIPYIKGISGESNAIAEGDVEFQRLASAISLQSPRNTRLLVTSAMTGEGKTSITLRLASALTDLGFRVLMVDGDFRKAELSHRLGHTQKRDNELEVVQLHQNLDFVPTIPQQPGKIVDLVSQGRFERYLAVAESSQDYDYVLVDSAPVSLTSETALMSAIVTDILFVVRPGISTRNIVNESLDQLAQHKARVIGLVVNAVKDRSRSYSYSTNPALITPSQEVSA